MERRHHSNSPRSLVFLTFGCSKTLLERPPRATARSRSGPERYYHSDTKKSLVFVAFWNAKNDLGATSSERLGQVTREERPGSDVFGATRPSRSRRATRERPLRSDKAKSLAKSNPGATSSERQGQVARE
ncbi:hypothetical protein F2Q69_00049954 [Brassica cretica]|uniref:Uncharacterized protein n=1 Tax=Brassica cretica TaxID=69181 RepID=A0A8S9Q802_BRACR|nr:hypothetical protein F2Q69_00049954 [Brassica cretica]